ncbi:Nucleoside-diphosphate-sugar epimerase [Pseudoxanthomonas sp. GM95]|uniref:NAD-dependent epimerase/dehydratase family protein n=1 Tax=Pseudoxanthomonas sp. GM95 TaxID=1881043 RepID=UPI0008B48A0E|nr:NAD-dependent epimerase/dehydratase family protein [Pseudoxanthomonas sp. GM95]SEK40721.1 Nucleoside-diphosphate-sugar epimerase [Pseudoxanthomonas sp. GM95]
MTSVPSTPARTALLLGGSGQIGQALLARLRAQGWSVLAVSRSAQPAQDGVQWLSGELQQMPPLPASVDAIFSAGPLDAFARWYAEATLVCPRVVAFGSTSLGVKQDSADAYERDLAARLRGGEDAVFQRAVALGAQATLLRPTLVYGVGRDATLTQIAALARRLRCFPLPHGADGLRQPVHVDDLADAALAVVDVDATFGKAYALGGGETLPYRAMVARTLAAMSPPARLLELPAPVFRLAVGAAQRIGIARSLNAAAVARMRDDLVFDLAPARRDFGYAPRGFAPTAAMLGQ